MQDLIQNDLIIVGSAYFFSDYPEFNKYTHDVDKLEIVDYPVKFKYYQQIQLLGKDIFRWVKYPPEQMIEIELNMKCPMQIGKYLIPEVAQKFGMTIEHLKQLQPLIDTIDEKHTYEKIIYDAYLENNSFTLTQAQRDKAYEEYKRKRLDRLENK